MTLKEIIQLCRDREVEISISVTNGRALEIRVYAIDDKHQTHAWLIVEDCKRLQLDDTWESLRPKILHGVNKVTSA